VTEPATAWREEILEVHSASELVPGMYSRLSRVYELWARLTESRARRRVLELAAIDAPEDVLEVATGTGVQLASLATANRGGLTAGVELSEGMLRETRRRLAGEGLSDVALIPGSGLDLPFADESFDLVVNGYMLDLLPRDEIPRALAEFDRVLRPGGRLVLSNMTVAERRRDRIWDWLYSKGVVLTANCRGVLAAPVLTELGFTEIEREYVGQMSFPTEIVRARKGGEVMSDPCCPGEGEGCC
jgi:demethylmenaquinone methyltransferase/2-methoxy-6-polyprenyl-1,4-benzoquinol methylase